MKKLVLFFAALLLMPSVALANSVDGDEEAVRYAVAEYIAGWREGNVERLARVFEVDHGHIIWRSGEGDDETISSMTFGEALANRRPNQGYGEPYRIEKIDIVDGYLAVVRFDVERSGKGSYVDYFMLYKVRGEWKIVVKAFTSRPGVLLSDG